MKDVSDNSDEYGTFVQAHYNGIYRFCMSQLHQNDTLSLEAVNDVMVILSKKWDTLDRGDAFGVWLYRTARNVIMQKKEQLAKEKQLGVLDYDGTGMGAADGRFRSETGVEPSAEESFFAQEDDRMLDDAIEHIMETLEEEDAELFQYRFIEKRNLKEVSALSGIPYSTLRRRLDRIEKDARAIIRDFFDR